MTARVSSAGKESRMGGFRLLAKARTTSCCSGLVDMRYPPATWGISIPGAGGAVLAGQRFQRGAYARLDLGVVGGTVGHDRILDELDHLLQRDRGFSRVDDGFE